MAGAINILVISDSAKGVDMLTEALIEADFTVAATATPKQDILGLVKDYSIDIIVAYLEEATLAFMNQMYNLNQDTPRPVIIFTERSQSELIRGAVHAGISAFVVDGFSVKRIRPVVELAMARFDEEQILRDELKQAKSKLQERKLIEKAKGIIMEKRQVREDEAYQSLRKLAMDRNQRIADVAEDVINVSKLL